MNDFNLISLEKANEFFAKKPILLGNDISFSTIDFYINLGNTFLKTDTGGNQIYLGISDETVGIGYSSNEHLSPAHGLHVARGIDAKNICTSYVSHSCMQPWGQSNQMLTAGDVVCCIGYGHIPIVGPSVTTQEHSVFGVCVTDASIESHGIMTEVAISGIASIKVLGPVTAGDLLESSSTRGIAQASVSTELHSYTIGKSLETNSTTGIVTVKCKLML
jgi:hypothetical protein